MYEVICAGYPGDSTCAMLKRMDRDVLAYKPTAVTVQCGTNDAINPRAKVPLAGFIRNLDVITGTVRDHGAQVLLIIPPPCIPSEVIFRYKFDYPAGTDLNQTLQEYASAMKTFALGKKIPYVDLFSLFRESGRVGPGKESLIRNKANSNVEDGAHPTEKGYRLIGRRVYGALIGEGFDCTRLVCFGDSMTFGYPYEGMGTLEGPGFPAVVSGLLNGETE